MRRRSPLRWKAITLSIEPSRRPPMNTAGTGVLRPTSLTSSRCICFPSDAEVGEEGLHGVAEAAGAHAKDHHCFLRRQPHHPVH
ncbi:unnamed protein product [Spirodela intermedia]|uniref:Uncharacterized protein n=1 Tax=Spirodela intermedia TaxID=51605 RepID=A0A7I8KLV3_SPIIN|nr:unnamed protein product [Spirodela intermedia]